MKRIIAPFLLTCAVLAGAGEPAPTAQTGRVVRVTDLRAGPAADSALLEVLKANAEVPVLERQGGWYRVKVGERSGWVRLTAVRFATATPSSGGGLTASLGFLRSGRSAVQSGTVTTGVRGLSETDIQNAVADPAAVDALDRLAVPTADAQQYAQALGLAPTKVDFIKPPKDKDDKDKDKRKDDGEDDE